MSQSTPVALGEVSQVNLSPPIVTPVDPSTTALKLPSAGFFSPPPATTAIANGGPITAAASTVTTLSPSSLSAYSTGCSNFSSSPSIPVLPSSGRMLVATTEPMMMSDQPRPDQLTYSSAPPPRHPSAAITPAASSTPSQSPPTQAGMMPMPLLSRTRTDIGLEMEAGGDASGASPASTSSFASNAPPLSRILTDHILANNNSNNATNNSNPSAPVYSVQPQPLIARVATDFMLPSSNSSSRPVFPAPPPPISRLVTDLADPTVGPKHGESSMDESSGGFLPSASELETIIRDPSASPTALDAMTTSTYTPSGTLFPSHQQYPATTASTNQHSSFPLLQRIATDLVVTNSTHSSSLPPPHPVAASGAPPLSRLVTDPYDTNTVKRQLSASQIPNTQPPMMNVPPIGLTRIQTDLHLQSLGEGNEDVNDNALTQPSTPTDQSTSITANQLETR